MHEPTASLRQRTPPAVHASPTAQGWREARRGLLVAVVGGVFLAFTGAFGSSEAPWLLRFIYWLVVMVAGAGFGAGVSWYVGRRGWFEGNDWLQGGLTVVLIAAPLTLAVCLFSTWMFARRFQLSDLPWFFGPVLLVSAVMTALNYLIVRRPPETHAAAPDAPPVRFVERLPPKLKGAEVYAVEAEDHYLRVHTSRGSDLILLRLADAVAELEGLEGAQTHRSWWVAKTAVLSAERTGGRAVLTLKDGAQAPVSRTYVKALREAGWF